MFVLQNKLGDTALHAAAWKGHSDIVEMLLKKSEWLYCFMTKLRRKLAEGFST